MVKEYSRSAADQKEPLNHHIRPLICLERTMDYLIVNIMERLNDQNFEEWFDFIWNCTRAIRKDITQQNLNDMRTVNIIEKCVRFHICCKSIPGIDQKINNENLEHSLHSLTHLYRDFRINGINCSNESEFVSYDILQNIADPPYVTMRLHKLPKNILQSKLIRIALHCFNSFQQNNFVLFFKIISNYDHLSYFLLQNNFNIIRFNGFKALAKACSLKSTINGYPIKPLIKCFGFYSLYQLKSYCNTLEQTVSSDLIHFNLNKLNSMDVLNLPNPLACNLFEVKKSTLIGVLVNGGHLPANPYRRFSLHNSFNSANVLKQEAFNAEDQHAKLRLINYKISGGNGDFGNHIEIKNNHSLDLTEHQKSVLKSEFLKTGHLSRGKRFLLAERLDVTEYQIKEWSKTHLATEI